MPAPYRPYLIQRIGQETEEVRSFVCVPADGQPVPEFRAGQFFMIRQNDVPGLKPPMRSYSAARTHTPGSVCFGIKKHGNFTHALFDKKEGSRVEISGPYGFFTLARDEAPIVLLAAGIGITPLMCMAEELTRAHDARDVRLFYSNRHAHHAAFLPVLAQMADENKNLRLIATLTGEELPPEWRGERGRIEVGMLRRQGVDLERARFYFCGPKAFNEGMEKMLLDAGVAKERIHKENW